MVLETMPYQLSYYGLSDVGHVRENNEDVWKAIPDSRCFIVADGIGGHRAGEVAAHEAVGTLSRYVEEMVGPETPAFSFEEAHGMIQLAIERTNEHVYDLGSENPDLKGMGTTLCVTFFHPKGLVYAHVGDSRIYRLRHRKLDPLTRDHSLLREMLDRGHLQEDESSHIGFKNVITRAIGTDKHIDPTVHMSEVTTGDYYIMCTDGLTDMLKNDEIQSIANRYTEVELITEALVATAKEKGGKDNITVLTILVHE